MLGIILPLFIPVGFTDSHIVIQIAFTIVLELYLQRFFLVDLGEFEWVDDICNGDSDVIVWEKAEANVECDDESEQGQHDLLLRVVGEDPVDDQQRAFQP